MLTKSCPRWRGKWHEVPKGVRLKTAECRELFPLSFAYAQQLPRKRWSLWVQYKLGVQCRTPSRSDRFNGVTGVQGGLRGEIEIFPGPPAKRLYSNSQLFVYVNPSVKPSVCQLPVEGSLLVQYTSSNDNPAKRAYIPYSPFSTVRVLE